MGISHFINSIHEVSLPSLTREEISRAHFSPSKAFAAAPSQTDSRRNRYCIRLDISYETTTNGHVERCVTQHSGPTSRISGTGNTSFLSHKWHPVCIHRHCRDIPRAISQTGHALDDVGTAMNAPVCDTSQAICRGAVGQKGHSIRIESPSRDDTTTCLKDYFWKDKSILKHF